jgi:hypothetical protein
MWPFHKYIEVKPVAETVTCITCGHIIAKSRAQHIKHFYEYGSTDDWYCQDHKKPYDKHYFALYGYSNTYLKEMSVDVNGCPIGYIKIPEVANDITT